MSDELIKEEELHEEHDHDHEEHDHEEHEHHHDHEGHEGHEHHHHHHHDDDCDCGCHDHDHDDDDDDDEEHEGHHHHHDDDDCDCGHEHHHHHHHDDDCDCGCHDHDHEHDHEHHHHHEHSNIEISTHEDATIATVKMALGTDKDAAKVQLKSFMTAVGAEAEAEGGMVGHIKFFLKESVGEMFSMTDPEDEIQIKPAALPEYTAEGVCIVVGISPDAREDIVKLHDPGAV